ncbi:MAG: ATP-binding protein [Candidatus Omnitrophota bacterium]|jgi:two-component system NtrC family sensor kinase
MIVVVLIAVIIAFAAYAAWSTIQWKKKLGEKTRQIKETEAQVIHMEKMASLGTLAAGVAHEINNPLSFLISNLECIRDYFKAVPEGAPGAEKDPPGGAVEEVRAMVIESLIGAMRIKRIVSDLRLFSRRGEPQMVSVDPNQILESVLAIIWNEMKNKITFNKDYQSKTALLAEPTQLSQVFLNLLINAGQAIQDKGVISLVTFEDKKNVFIKISDTGSGIPDDVRPRIFDPFFSTKKSTGLGLSVSYNIIKKHGGDISVESKPGVGTAFTVSLPKKQEGDVLK